MSAALFPAGRNSAEQKNVFEDETQAGRPNRDRTVDQRRIDRAARLTVSFEHGGVDVARNDIG